MYSTKNAFKKLVKRCIAEYLMDNRPQEQWTDTFGKKMPGEYTVEGSFFPKQFVPEAAGQENKISPGERNKISQAFAKVGADGNGRFEKVEAGLSAVTQALNSLGYNLDMVSKDLIMGERGSRMFIFRRKNDQGQDIYTEKPEIGNSRIVFSWENMSQQGMTPKFEILAYAS